MWRWGQVSMSMAKTRIRRCIWVMGARGLSGFSWSGLRFGRSARDCAPTLSGHDLFNSLQRGILPVQPLKRFLRWLQLFQQPGSDILNPILEKSGTHAALSCERIPVFPGNDRRVSLVSHGKRQTMVDALNGTGANEVIERRQPDFGIGAIEQ